MVSYSIENRIRPAAFEDVRLLGYQGKLAELFFKNRILSQEAKETVYREAESAYSDPRDDETEIGFWRGEFWGKWIISACRVARYEKDAELKAFVGQAARNLLTWQREDGYLGSYRNADNVIAPDPDEMERKYGMHVRWNWNIWCRKYTLWGLVEAYELTEDPVILQGAVKFSDHLIGELARLGLKVRDTGTFDGLPTGSIMKPMLTLYRLTGDRKYLEFCEDIAADWDRPDGKVPNIIGNALSGKRLNTWYEGEKWAKAYEMMSCFDGILELYRVTGVKKYLDASERYYENLFENEQNMLFAVGYNDLFADAAMEINGINEPCDVIHWMRLCYELFCLTGNPRYMDTFERAYLNPFLAGVFEDGKWGARGVRTAGRHLIARQMDFIYNHCCVNNIPRAFMNAAEAALMKGEDGYYLNLFTEGEYRVGPVRVRVSDGYTREGKVTFIAENEGEETVLLIRVPGWCEKSTFAAEGAVIRGEAGSYCEIPLKAFSVTRIDANFGFEMKLRGFSGEVIRRSETEWKYVRWINKVDKPFSRLGDGKDEAYIREKRETLLWGPVILAQSKKIGSEEQEMFGTESVGAKAEVSETRALPWEGQCAFEVCLRKENGEEKKVRMCDYAGAGNRISEDPLLFSIWV